MKEVCIFLILILLILIFTNKNTFGEVSCASNDHRMYPSGRLPGSELKLTEEEINNTLLPGFMSNIT